MGKLLARGGGVARAGRAAQPSPRMLSTVATGLDAVNDRPEALPGLGPAHHREIRLVLCRSPGDEEIKVQLTHQRKTVDIVLPGAGIEDHRAPLAAVKPHRVAGEQKAMGATVPQVRGPAGGMPRERGSPQDPRRSSRVP